MRLIYIEALQLRKDGSTFRRLERINKWLTGVYHSEDFMELAAADEHSAWVERANARTTFLDRASGAVVDLSWANSPMDEPHPLEALKTDETVRSEDTPSNDEEEESDDNSHIHEHDTRDYSNRKPTSK